jgi:endonuclease III
VIGKGPLATRSMSAALERIRAFHAEAPPAVVTSLARSNDPFIVLVSTIISLRTRDEVTDAVTPKLMAVAPNAEALARTRESTIARLIYPAGFYRTKAKQLRAIGKVLVERHGGRVPDSLDDLLALKGVGRKTANLVVTLGFGKPGICVDTHVHRISNRLGFVVTKTPDETEAALRARLPKRWWIPINDLLVVFGQRQCVPISPKCSSCPVRDLCHRVGVTKSR